MMRQLRQTIFEKGKGDCFKTCVAMVLDLPPEPIPNFCAGDPVLWFAEFQKWLEQFHLTAVEVRLDLGPVLARTAPGVPVILSGHSPNVEGVLHSVVGVAVDEGFEYLYDPNPSDQFLKGEPIYVIFFASLRPDRVKHDRNAESR